jgi:hypothetical protein
MKDRYEEEVLKQLEMVFGRIPAFVGGNPYGGGKSYYNENGKLEESGLFVFETEEELDTFIKTNRHCEYVKVGDTIY